MFDSCFVEFTSGLNDIIRNMEHNIFKHSSGKAWHKHSKISRCGRDIYIGTINGSGRYPNFHHVFSSSNRKRKALQENIFCYEGNIRCKFIINGVLRQINLEKRFIVKRLSLRRFRRKWLVTFTTKYIPRKAQGIVSS